MACCRRVALTCSLPLSDTPSITAKLINEQKEDKEKKNHDEKEKMKTDSGFQDNYSVVVASGTRLAPSSSNPHHIPSFPRLPIIVASQEWIN